MATVTPTLYRLSRDGTLTTLEQRFLFTGAKTAAIRNVLATAPLVGARSIFGDRPGTEGTDPEGVRTLAGFSPAPGFRFDVTMSRLKAGLFVVRFSQPDRRVPYLAGEFVWAIQKVNGGTMFNEEINTEAAMNTVSEPLAGSGRSVRRWLFFRAGHKRVMDGATRNIAVLAS